MPATPKAIKATLQIQVKNGSFRDLVNPDPLEITQSAVGCGGYVQSIGITEEVVNFGDITMNGVLFLQNLDAAHYLVFGPESAGAMVVIGKLLPGEFAFLRLAPAVVLRARADTAAVLVDVRLYEN